MAEEDYWTPTIETLGKIVTKPTLTEVRLKQPPFRFLRDIVVAVRDQTGFPEGLYEESELDEANLKDKPQRVTFIKKIIDATAYTLGTRLAAQPAKVVAGTAPELTNQWLQALAEACSKPKSAQEKGVKKALAKAAEAAASGGKEAKEGKESKESAKEGKEKSRKEKDKKDEKPAAAAGEEKKRSRDKEERKERDGKEKKESSSKDREGRKEKESKESKSKPLKADPALPVAAPAPAPPPEEIDPLAAAAARLRPSTARAPPPMKKEAAQRVDSTAGTVSNTPTAAGVIRAGRGGDEDDDDDEPDIDVEAQRVAEDAAALGGEAAGYMARAGQEVIEAARAKLHVIREDRDDDLILAGTRKTTKRSTFDDEVAKMRANLQVLINATQPLGKAMDYIQEDLDAMRRELTLLRNETTQQKQLYVEQLKMTDLELNPLQKKLEDLERDINEQHHRGRLVKASILGNDDTVRVLLRMVVIPDMDA